MSRDGQNENDVFGVASRHSACRGGWGSHLSELDMKSTVAAAALFLGAMSFVGCASRHEEGVTSSYRSQWTKVNANTEDTTKAAEAVLNDRELKNVTSSSTKVDGKAMGQMADGTKVNVSIEKSGDTMSQVSVTVGTIGDPTLGAEIAKAVKTRAEGGTERTSATTRRSAM
jgi:hypothetical protein